MLVKPLIHRGNGIPGIHGSLSGAFRRRPGFLRLKRCSIRSNLGCSRTVIGRLDFGPQPLDLGGRRTSTGEKRQQQAKG